MKLIADANILFSCLIKPGITRQLWFHSDVQLYSPSFIMLEFLKYREYLEKKSKIEKNEFNCLVEKTISQISITSDDALKPYLLAVATLSNDKNDSLYLACALKENAAIWRNDVEFKKQTRVPVKTTQELIEELFK